MKIPTRLERAEYTVGEARGLDVSEEAAVELGSRPRWWLLQSAWPHLPKWVQEEISDAAEG